MDGVEMDVLLHVFARLELHELGKLRCVCRSWRRGIGSEKFARLWEGRGRPCSVLRVRSMGGGRAARPLARFHTQVWYPGEVDTMRGSGLSPGPPGRLSLGITSSCGLVCGLLLLDRSIKDAPRWRFWKGTPWEFVVGNPVNNKWRALPPFRMPPALIDHQPLSIEKVHLHVGTESYQLVVLFSSADIVYYAGQYDSISGQWSFARPLELPEGGIDNANDCVLGSRALQKPPHYLPAYHPASMLWSCYKRFVITNENDEAAGPDNSKLFLDDDWEATCMCGVLRWRGKAIMVSHTSKYLVVSELDEGGGVWRVVATRRYRDLYSRWAVEFDSARRGRPAFSVQPQLGGDWLVFTQAFGWCFSSAGVYAPVAYNLERSTWHVCHSPYPFGSVDIEASFTFFPSFTAQP